MEKKEAVIKTIKETMSLTDFRYKDLEVKTVNKLLSKIYNKLNSML